ncbi:hypothetical protein BU15DRAFT_72248 [Melanogaster broomeanus]|nr:hypothetical protein BU15DRAFT_72248 [Melanogaster broomeanus]
MSPPSTATSTCQQHPSAQSAPASRSSQLSLMKGKNTLEQMMIDLKDHLDAASQEQKLSSGVLKNECYNMKMQAFMHDKEISFLESQQISECAEAEDIHRHELEVKKSKIELWRADAEVLDREREVLTLKLRLAEFTAVAQQSGSTMQA